MGGNVALPAFFGAATCAPLCAFNHSLHSGHQLPSTLCACSTQSDASSCSSPIQWLRLRLAGGLMTPAMWPLAPSTKRLLPPSSCVLAKAVCQGTIWSSREA